MIRHRATLVVAVIALTALPCAGQIVSPQDAYPDKYPGPLPRRDGPPPPKLVFEKLVETPVPGPARPDAFALEDDRLVLALPQGFVSVSAGPAPNGGARPEPDRSNTGSPDPWVVSPDAKRRYSSDPSGWVVAQKRRSTEHRWRKAWRLRVPGATGTRPLLLGPRLLFGARDNQVYCVRADNGHRIWTRDLGERLSRPLVVWRGEFPAPAERGSPPEPHAFELILVVPDSGSSIVALDPFDGTTVGAASLAREEGWLVSPPTVLDDGRVAVVRQGYAPEDAAVAFYRLGVPPSEDLSNGSPVYNAGSPAPATSRPRR